MFAGEEIPACGFSLGLERILVVMTEKEMFPAGLVVAGPDILLTIFDDPQTDACLRLASELRAADLRVEIFPETTKRGKNLNKALKYASERKARFVAIIEEEELADNTVKLRNPATREQERVPQAELATRLVSHIGHRPSPIGHRTTNER
jgi:histidyl-tRNA synthetase